MIFFFHLYSLKHLTCHSPLSLYLSAACIIFLKRANQCRLYNCTLRATYEENAIPYKYFGCTLFWFCAFSFLRRQRCCRAATLKCTRLNCVCGEVTLNPLGTRSETTIIGKKIKLWLNKCALACGGR